MAGFTLLEVMVALFVLSIGMLGVAGLQVASKRANADSTQRTIAVLLAQELMERIRANPTALTIYTAAGTGQTLDIGSAIPQAAADCTAAECTPEQLASFDIAEFATVLSGAAEQRGGASVGGLSSPTVCITGPAALPGTVVVAVAWRGSTATSNPTSNTCGATSGLYDDPDAGANTRRRVLVLESFVEEFYTNGTTL